MPNLGARLIPSTLADSTQNGVAGAKKYKKKHVFDPTIVPLTIVYSIKEALVDRFICGLFAARSQLALSSFIAIGNWRPEWPDLVVLRPISAQFVIRG